MGVYDIPAAIDYILNVTSAQKLIYIGHSLGTTTFYAFATNRPEYSDKIVAQISMAPVAAIPHTTSIFRVLVPIAKEIEVSENHTVYNPYLPIYYNRFHFIYNFQP